MLVFSDVRKSYRNLEVLKGLTLSVPRGSLFGLMGQNGAGKTTLLRIAAGLLALDSGELLVGGIDVRRDPARAKRLIGFVPDGFGAYDNMSVSEYMSFFASCFGLYGRSARLRVEDLLQRVGLSARQDSLVTELSKGMQQKVQFIITVVHRPALLIFDEPFSGFDPVNAEQLKCEMLRLKAEGRTLIFSTHNMSSVEEVCDEIALIDHSRVVLSGNVHEVRERYKEHLFEVEYVGAITLQPDPTRYTLISAAPSGGGTAIRIRKSPTVSNAELLVSLSAQG